MEAWLTEEYLATGYVEVVGNATFFQLQYQDTPPWEEEEDFYSSARKIDGTRKIDEFNTNDDPDWWR